MKNFCFLLLLALFVNTFANADKWNGTYHYYSSEELPGGNDATIESVLTLTPKKCEYSVAGFQVDKSYICKGLCCTNLSVKAFSAI